MAENKKRKSTRAFNIEKHSERHFDLEKEDTVVASASVAPAASPKTTEGSKPQSNVGNAGNSVSSVDASSNGNDSCGASIAAEDGGNGGSKKSLVVIIAIIIAAVLAFFGYKSCGNGSSASDEAVPMDTASNASDQANTTSQQPSAQADSAAAQNNTAEISSTGEAQEGNAATTNEATSSAQSESVETNSLEEANQSSNTSVKDKAMQVWDGVYGNDPERRHKLGSDYKDVQRYVNKMYRNGYRH